MFIICQLSYWFKKKKAAANKKNPEGVEDLEQSKQEKREQGAGP